MSTPVFSSPPLLVSVKQACRILSVGETRMYELLGTNTISVLQSGQITPNRIREPKAVCKTAT